MYPKRHFIANSEQFDCEYFTSLAECEAWYHQSNNHQKMWSPDS